jgi:predicted 3-demethylubiquinone-9 3-methyltransferase (glyoxalase superfamily)
MVKSITPFLMFEGDAEAAMNFYVSLFADARIETITRYDANGPGKPGSVMVAAMILNGQKLMCIDSTVKHNFTFTPAISLFVECDGSEEVERLFQKLSEGGKVLMPLDAYPFAKRFGWANDRFGVSWQVRFA